MVFKLLGFLIMLPAVFVVMFSVLFGGMYAEGAIVQGLVVFTIGAGIYYLGVSRANRNQSTTCPHCAEQILAAAKVCKHCGRDVAAKAA